MGNRPVCCPKDAPQPFSAVCREALGPYGSLGRSNLGLHQALSPKECSSSVLGTGKENQS